MLRLKLKELYEAKGVTQKQVSEELGIRAGTLSGLANNMRTSWDVQILEKLMEYFEIKDVRELIQNIPYQEIKERLKRITPQEIEEEFKDVFEDYYGKGKVNKDDY
ncbi:helix-turn-helix domain-containing protein [Neobacillus pocheonensis]|uniref:Helix-turn-helix domain-containing protein n=1 Tax=Neobacillus pocheonensis TaxID=363869 RepID=A0ABT0WFT3_9BACI|nr:helix-turn-helix domain-containing protein [Neobacillus pocheonensis]